MFTPCALYFGSNELSDSSAFIGRPRMRLDLVDGLSIFSHVKSFIFFNDCDPILVFQFLDVAVVGTREGQLKIKVELLAQLSCKGGQIISRVVDSC